MAVADAQRKSSRAEAAVEDAVDVPALTKDQELSAYRQMLLIRRFEEKAGQMYGMGLIGGFCHLYIGQEAVVVGMQMTLKAGDEVITGYRDHGHMLACGMDPKGVMAELIGGSTAIRKARAARCTCSASRRVFFGGHGIVGAQALLGTGLVFANKYRGNDHHVSLTYFGDGAANQGRSTRVSIWPSSGSCPSSTSSKTTINTAWALQWFARQRRPTLYARRRLRHSGRGGRWHGCAPPQPRARRL